MPDLDITIVEESTERISKDLSYIYTRRRTITIEDEPKPQTSSRTSMITKPASSVAQKKLPSMKPRAISFADRRAEQLISRNVTTAELPALQYPLQSHIQIWSNVGNERELNYMIQIKGFKAEKKEPRLVYERRSI